MKLTKKGTPIIERTIEFLFNNALCLPKAERKGNISEIIRITEIQQIRISKELKFLICKKCSNLCIPGETCKLKKSRKVKGFVSRTCLGCNDVKRFGLYTK